MKGSQKILKAQIPKRMDVNNQIKIVIYKKFAKINIDIAKNLLEINSMREIGFDKYRSINPLGKYETERAEVLNKDTNIKMEATEEVI